MGKNVMSLLNLSNKVSRNGFDLSQKVAFTAKAGELLPVSTVECIPGDKFKFDLSWFTRTQPLNTCAFTRCKEYVDCFFIPTNLLWNKFNTFVTQMNNNAQKATSINETFVVPTQHPYFLWADMWQMLQSAASSLESHQSDYSDYLDVAGQPRLTQSLKLLNYLGYGKPQSTFSPIKDDGSVSLALNPFPLLAYQKVYYDFYRDQQWEESLPYCFNIDYAGATGDASLKLDVSAGVNIAEDNMFTLRYANYQKDYFMGLLPDSQFGDVATVSIGGSASNLTGFVPLIYKTDGYNFIYTGSSDSFGQVIAPSAGGMADSGRNVTIAATSNGTPNNVAITTDTTVSNMSRLVDPAKVTFGVNLTGDSIDQTTAAQFSILALRRAEAAQRWAEITQANQKDYPHQVGAHFDHKVSDALGEHVMWLGGTSSVLDIAEVVNTNLNSGEDNISTSTASISGKGVGNGTGKINFTAPCHGILMCIYHVEPILDYDINGIDKFMLKTMPTDYAIPEYDRTGMVAIPQVEFCVGYSDSTTQYDFTKPLGYGLQYQEYKTRYDRVIGAFADGGMDSWCAPMTSEYYLKLLQDNNYQFTYQMKKINPSVLDTIFAVNAAPVLDFTQFAGTSENMQQYYKDELMTDQFLVNMYVGLNAVRPLDRNGLPY